MIVTILSHLLVRGYVETPFYSCQTRKTHMSHWGSFGQELQLSGWTRWSFFAKYLAPNFELFQAADEVALLVGKGFHISREMHFQDKREKNGCQTLFLSRLTLMPHTAGMILRKILTWVVQFCCRGNTQGRGRDITWRGIFNTNFQFSIWGKLTEKMEK